MKHKDEIIMNLKDYHAGRRVVTGGTNAFESKIDELNEVYSQVSEYEIYKVATEVLVNTLKSKADEYEEKAKAYDRVAEKLHARINHILMTSHPAQQKPGYVDGLYNALDIINSELKSGESK